MKKTKLLLAASALFMALLPAFAQSVTVKGVVTDASDGNTIPSASITIKGTATGVISGLDGEYSINVHAGSVLVFNSVGFKTQEITVGKQAVINCSLEPDVEFLNSIVVVAYGSQSVKTVTASVSSVKAEALKDAPNVSFDSMLQGQAAGVQVSNPNGGVGQSARIQIRGISSISAGTNPLYIVDGLPISSSAISTTYTDMSALADINPADILSIDVLKDAAATALYGSRAASGVVIITTKRGQKGETKVSYDMNIGIMQPTRMFDMMDAETYYTYKNQAVFNKYGTDEVDLGGGENQWGNKAFNYVKDKDGNIVNTKWADLIYKQGLVQNHTAAIQGGTSRTQYYISANYSDQQGIIIGDQYQRYGFKANVSTQANKWLKVGINGQYSNTQLEVKDASRHSGVFTAAGLPRQAMILPPIISPYNDDGTFAVHNNGEYISPQGIRVAALGYPHPLAGQNNFNDIATSRVIASAYAEVAPVQNLTLKTQFGIDHMKETEETFWTPLYGQGAQKKGYCFMSNGNSTNWTWTNTADYNLILGDHSANFLVGMEANSSYYYSSAQSAAEILNKAFTGYAAGYKTYTGEATYGQKTITSYFGRINYDYKAKYILSLNFRRDGLSALGANNRWGNFYGASAAWRVSDEPFFSPVKSVVDDFKIKASYGVVGNSEIGYYNAQSYYKQKTFGGKAGLAIANIGDQNLAWEKSTKYDVGFGLVMYNKINVDFDYYYTKSDNLVLAVPQGPSTGIGSLVTNAGSLENKGIEITIGAEVLKKGDFSWNTSFNFTTVHNKVLSLAEGVDAVFSDEDDGSGSNITVPGYSIGQLYLYPTGGIDPESGRRIFYGSHGEWTTYDPLTKSWYLKDGSTFQGDLAQVRAGNTVPTWFGGWANNFRYKGFDLNILMQFSGGNFIFNGNTATGSDNRWWNNFAEVATKSWKQKGDIAKYAFPVYGDNVSNGSAYDITDWIERGDYLRMKSISLGYTFRAGSKKSRWGFDSFRIYGQVQNAFVLTAYTGLDPEITSSYSADSNLSNGYDKNTLPQARTWTLGAQISF